MVLELKRRGGRLSESQAAMRENLEGCGFAYLCTDGVDQAIGWLQARGILGGGIVMIGDIGAALECGLGLVFAAISAVTRIS